MSPKKKKAKEQQSIIGFAWYRPNQWARLREVSEDRDKLEKTYLEWSDLASRRFNALLRARLPVRRVDVDIEELVEWCRGQGLPVNGESRSRYVVEKMREEGGM